VNVPYLVAISVPQVTPPSTARLGMCYARFEFASDRDSPQIASVRGHVVMEP